MGIWSVTVEGNAPELVVDWPEGAWAPAWSPDGSAIVFSSKRSPGEDESTDDNIWAMRADGTDDATWITAGSQADWSPDGTQICFIRDDDVWVIPSVGGRETRILRTPEREAWPQWSPDGTQILYSEAPGDYEIWVADVGKLLESGN